MKILPTNQTAQTPIILKDNTTQHTPIKENIEREGAPMTKTNPKSK